MSVFQQLLNDLHLLLCTFLFFTFIQFFTYIFKSIYDEIYKMCENTEDVRRKHHSSKYIHKKRFTS